MSKDLASWLGLIGTALQLLGSLMTLWGLLSATEGWGRRIRALVGALFRSAASRTAAELSLLNPDERVRVLQGLSVLTAGYLLALVAQLGLMYGG